MNGKMWKIASYYSDIKKKIKSTDSPLYIQLTNAHEKFFENLSTLFENRKIEKIDLSEEEKIKAFIQYVIDNNNLPQKKTEIMLNGKMWKIGVYYNTIKNKIKSIDSPLYIQLTNSHEKFQENLSTLFENRKIEKIDLTEEEKIEELIQYVIDNNEVPQQKTEILMNGKIWKIGKYYSHIKTKIKSIDSPLYLQLTSAHEIFRENLNNTFKKREK